MSSLASESSAAAAASEPDPISMPAAASGADPISMLAAASEPDPISMPAAASGAVPISMPAAASGPDPSSMPAVASETDSISMPAAASGPDPSSMPAAASGPDPSSMPAAASGTDPMSMPAAASGPDAMSMPAAASGPDASIMCVICRDDISRTCNVVAMPCAHTFHSHCLRAFAVAKRAPFGLPPSLVDTPCPTCKAVPRQLDPQWQEPAGFVAIRLDNPYADVRHGSGSGQPREVNRQLVHQLDQMIHTVNGDVVLPDEIDPRSLLLSQPTLEWNGQAETEVDLEVITNPDLHGMPPLFDYEESDPDPIGAPPRAATPDARRAREELDGRARVREQARPLARRPRQPSDATVQRRVAARLERERQKDLDHAEYLERKRVSQELKQRDRAERAAAAEAKKREAAAAKAAAKAKAKTKPKAPFATKGGDGETSAARRRAMKAMSASQVDQDEQLGEETEADPQQRDVREFMVRSAGDTAGSSSASGSRAVGAAADAGVHGGTVLADVLSSCGFG